MTDPNEDQKQYSMGDDPVSFREKSAPQEEEGKQSALASTGPPKRNL